MANDQGQTAFNTNFAESGRDPNAAFPWNPTPAIAPNDPRIAQLQQQVAEITTRIAQLVGYPQPMPLYNVSFFLAKITGHGTSGAKYTWDQQTNISQAIVPFGTPGTDGGLQCSSATDAAAAIEEMGATFVETGRIVLMKAIGDGTNTNFSFSFVGPMLATITAHTGSAGTTGFNPYTVSTVLGSVTITGVTNGFEPFNGSPGTLGVNVNSSGVVNGGSCVVQPIGNAAIVSLTWNGSNWTFAQPNSAQ